MNQKVAQTITLNVTAAERANRLLKRVAREVANEKMLPNEAEVINICTEQLEIMYSSYF